MVQSTRWCIIVPFSLPNPSIESNHCTESNRRSTLSISPFNEDLDLEHLSYESSRNNTTEMRLINSIDPTIHRFGVNHEEQIEGFATNLRLNGNLGHNATIIANEGYTHSDLVHTDNDEYATTTFTKFSNVPKNHIANESIVKCVDPNEHKMSSDLNCFPIDVIVNVPTSMIPTARPTECMYFVL